MTKIRMVSLVLFNLLLITVFPIKSISRPAYTLTQTDDFIVQNDYELIAEESSTDGTITIYSQTWI